MLSAFAGLGSLKRKREAKKALKTITEDVLVESVFDLRRLEQVYEPVIREYSLTIICLVASAETFVNEVAAVVLTGRQAREHFDKLSVQAKWYFLPRLMGHNKLFGFDREPLQSFTAAVRSRNLLLHSKGKSTQVGASKVPNFSEGLGLTRNEIDRSIESVRQLIRQFSLKWKGSFGPYWLYPDDEHFRRGCFFLGDRKSNAIFGDPEEVP